MKHHTLPIMFVGLWLLCLAACSPPNQASPHSTTPTLFATPTASAIPTPVATPAGTLSAAQRQEIAEIVWQTVNDSFFDPTFGGKDWQAISDEYLPLLALEQLDESFYRLLNEMLFKLSLSHTVALPPDMLNQLDSISFASGTIEIDIRHSSPNGWMMLSVISVFRFCSSNPR